MGTLSLDREGAPPLDGTRRWDSRVHAAKQGGLPRFVEKDFTAYLECGVLAHGFSRVVCSDCKDEFLVAYSCKHRGVCPSCNARRAHDTAIHLEVAVLPVELLEADAAEAEAEALPTDPRGYEETWANVLALQRAGLEPAAFAAITAPVLMLHGEDDPHPGPATRDTLVHFIPRLQYGSLERCGHVPWRERHARDAFLLALESWLAPRAASPA